MSFLYEPEPPRGVATEIAEGIRRIVAKNPSPMAYHGTNTYLVSSDMGLLVIDPGPKDDDEHLSAILEAAGEKIAAVVLTHGHQDHCGAVAALCRRTGAPLAGFAPSVADLVPDIVLQDGKTFAGFDVLHLPGHAADHIGLARKDGILFSGDHVMAWCSTVVGPKGDMAAFFQSLRRLLERDDRVYLPGHGPLLPNPKPHVERLLSRRIQREAELLEALRAQPQGVPDLAAALYAKDNPVLRRAAERNVAAHLRKLTDEGRVAADGDLWRCL